MINIGWEILSLDSVSLLSVVWAEVSDSLVVALGVNNDKGYTFFQ